MPVAKQLSVVLENRPGALAELCTELAKVAVNIQALQLSPAGSTGPVRLVVSQLEAAKKVCKEAGLKFTEEDVLRVMVNDRPGALGKLTRKLAEKGIQIEYAYGSIARGSKQALIVMGVSDLAAAARLLK